VIEEIRVKRKKAFFINFYLVFMFKKLYYQ
jgi:hypothetical protein